MSRFLGLGTTKVNTKAQPNLPSPNPSNNATNNKSLTPVTSSSTPSPPIMSRRTWADKIREKLPPVAEREYEVLWERGVLGVIFLEGENGVPYVSKATESCISDAVNRGDVLKYVNAVHSLDHTFNEFFKILATMKKPVLLRFERPAINSQIPIPVTGGAPTKSPNPQTTQSPTPPRSGERTLSTPPQVPPINTEGSNKAMNAKNTRSTPTSTKELSPTSDGLDFEVSWEKGSLGIIFGKDRKRTPLPVVAKIAAGSNPSVQEKVAVHDILISANGVKTKDNTFDEFFAKLQEMAQNKPVRLAFRRTRLQQGSYKNKEQPTQQINRGATLDLAEVVQGETQGAQPRKKSTSRTDKTATENPLDTMEFEVSWENGSLGLIFGKDRKRTSLPVVAKMTTGPNTMVHTQVGVGDILISANGVRTQDFSFDGFFTQMHDMANKKPVKLVFQRRRTPAVASPTVRRPSAEAQAQNKAVRSKSPSLGEKAASAANLTQGQSTSPTSISPVDRQRRSRSFRTEEQDQKVQHKPPSKINSVGSLPTQHSNSIDAGAPKSEGSNHERTRSRNGSQKSSSARSSLDRSRSDTSKSLSRNSSMTGAVSTSPKPIVTENIAAAVAAVAAQVKSFNFDSDSDFDSDDSNASDPRSPTNSTTNEVISSSTGSNDTTTMSNVESTITQLQSTLNGDDHKSSPKYAATANTISNNATKVADRSSPRIADHIAGPDTNNDMIEKKNSPKIEQNGKVSISSDEGAEVASMISRFENGARSTSTNSSSSTDSNESNQESPSKSDPEAGKMGPLIDDSNLNNTLPAQEEAHIEKKAQITEINGISQVDFQQSSTKEPFQSNNTSSVVTSTLPTAKLPVEVENSNINVVNDATSLQDDNNEPVKSNKEENLPSSPTKIISQFDSDSDSDSDSDVDSFNVNSDWNISKEDENASKNDYDLKIDLKAVHQSEMKTEQADRLESKDLSKGQIEPKTPEISIHPSMVFNSDSESDSDTDERAENTTVGEILSDDEDDQDIPLGIVVEIEECDSPKENNRIVSPTNHIDGKVEEPYNVVVKAPTSPPPSTISFSSSSSSEDEDEDEEEEVKEVVIESPKPKPLRSPTSTNSKPRLNSIEELNVPSTLHTEEVANQVVDSPRSADTDDDNDVNIKIPTDDEVLMIGLDDRVEDDGLDILENDDLLSSSPPDNPDEADDVITDNNKSSTHVSSSENENSSMKPRQKNSFGMLSSSSGDGNDNMIPGSLNNGNPKLNKAAINASLAKYKKRAKNSRPLVKLPALGELEARTVPLVAPNAVNTNVQVRGRTKPKPTLSQTPECSTYLVKWKESRGLGLQLKEVKLSSGIYPLVVDVCQDKCCELLKHVCVGDVILEINGRNTSTMGVKKTVNFLKTCSKTALLKLRHGPAYVLERVSAHV